MLRCAAFLKESLLHQCFHAWLCFSFRHVLQPVFHMLSATRAFESGWYAPIGGFFENTWPRNKSLTPPPSAPAICSPWAFWESALASADEHRGMCVCVCYCVTRSRVPERNVVITAHMVALPHGNNRSLTASCTKHRRWRRIGIMTKPLAWKINANRKKKS